MKTLGNIIWILFGGIFAALEMVFLGLFLCITVVGIPFGLQTFKVARLLIWPFGTEVKGNFAKHPIINTIWLIFVGLLTSIAYYIIGLLFCITIVGIPFGKQWFKLGKLIIAPFGAELK